MWSDAESSQTVVAIIATIAIGSSSSFFKDPSLMLDVKDPRCLFARVPRFPVKKQSLMDAMIAG